MLDRLRNLVSRLELPPEEQGDVVFRIIDSSLNTVEVTPAQYARWRMQHDVAQMAVVGHDIIESVTVRTTFSIMPENRSYKPFGTSAFDVSSWEPLLEHSRRYDTWEEAERGHRQTLERIRQSAVTARATDERAEALAGTAGEVRLAIAAGLPALFQVDEESENEVRVRTPLVREDGTSVELTVSADRSGFILAAAAEDSGPGSTAHESEEASRMLGALGVSAESEVLTSRTDDASELGGMIVRLAQAVAFLSYMNPGGR